MRIYAKKYMQDPKNRIRRKEYKRQWLQNNKDKTYETSQRWFKKSYADYYDKNRKRILDTQRTILSIA